MLADTKRPRGRLRVGSIALSGRMPPDELALLDGRISATNLMEFIYEHFPEVASLRMGETID